MYIWKEQADEIRKDLDSIVKAKGSGLDSLWTWLEKNKNTTGLHIFPVGTIYVANAEKTAKELVARWSHSGESSSDRGLELLTARITGALYEVSRREF